MKFKNALSVGNFFGAIASAIFLIGTTWGGAAFSDDDYRFQNCYFTQSDTCPDGTLTQRVNTNSCYVKNSCAECGGMDVAPFVTECPAPHSATCYTPQMQYCGDGSTVQTYQPTTCNIYRSCSECNASDTYPIGAQVCPERQSRTCYSERVQYCADGSSVTQYDAVYCNVYRSCSECGAGEYGGISGTCPVH